MNRIIKPGNHDLIVEIDLQEYYNKLKNNGNRHTTGVFKLAKPDYFRWFFADGYLYIRAVVSNKKSFWRCWVDPYDWAYVPPFIDLSLGHYERWHGGTRIIFEDSDSSLTDGTYRHFQVCETQGTHFKFRTSAIANDFYTGWVFQIKFPPVQDYR